MLLPLFGKFNVTLDSHLNTRTCLYKEYMKWYLYPWFSLGFNDGRAYGFWASLSLEIDNCCIWMYGAKSLGAGLELTVANGNFNEISLVMAFKENPCGFR